MHTLNSKKLDAYPSANIDENYNRQIDGSKKMSKIISNLQNQ